MMHGYSHLDRYLILALTITISSYVNSQQVFPTYADQPRWDVLEGFSSFEASWANTFVWGFSGDTALCGSVYDIGSMITLTGSPIMYTRVEGEKVYMRSTADCNADELLMYDFSLSVGDTASFAIYGGEGLTTVERWVVDVDTIHQFGMNRQRIMVESYYSTHEWVRGIGSLIHPFHPVAFPETTGHLYSTVLCYREQEDQLYQDPWFDTCDTSYSIIQSIEEQGINLATVGPNPFWENFSVTIQTTDPYSAELYAADGRNVFRMEQIQGSAMLGQD